MGVFLDNASDALAQIEADRHGAAEYIERFTYADPEAALGGNLDDLFHTLLIVLDAAEMNASRATLLADIETMKKKPGGLQKVLDDDFGGYTYSPGLDYLRRFVKGLRLCTSQAPKVSEFSRLEDMLRLTAVLVHRRKEVISGELHLQSIIHDYLKASFPSFTTIVVIQKELKIFKPDCGVTDVNTAVEFKIIENEQEVATAISGVIEDIGGYRGSKEWTRFFSVFYQKHPFMNESQARRVIERAGGDNWTPIVVNGILERKKRGKKKTPDQSREVPLHLSGV
jgi:hypothetical protein